MASTTEFKATTITAIKLNNKNVNKPADARTHYQWQAAHRSAGKD